MIRLSQMFPIRLATGLVALALLFLLTFSSSDSEAYSTASNAALVSFALLSILLAFVSGRTRLMRVNVGPIVAYGGVLFAMMLGTVIAGPNVPARNLQGLLNNVLSQLALISLLFSVACLTHWSAREWTRYVSAILLAFAIAASAVAFQRLLTGAALFGPFALSGSDWPQLYGWFSSPNFFVNAAAVGLLAACYKLSCSRRTAPIYALLVTVLLLSVGLSGSRGGMLATFLAFLGFLVLRLVIPQFRASAAVSAFGWTLGLLCFGMVSLFAYIDHTGIPRDLIARVILRLETLETGTGRLPLWNVALEMMTSANLRELLFGYGNGYFEWKTGSSAHNGHLRILVEFGLLTYALVLAAMYLSAAQALAHIRHGDSAVAFLWSGVALYVFFRTLFNSSIVSGGYLGLSFVLAIFILSLPVGRSGPVSQAGPIRAGPKFRYLEVHASLSSSNLVGRPSSTRHL